MPEDFNPLDPAASPENTPHPALKRWSSRLVLERLQRFAGRLKANARWMKQFLHGGK
jgi:hypothetical protein